MPSLLLPSFAVSVNGSSLQNDVQLKIVGITVEDDANVPSMFTLELAGLSEGLSSIPLLDDTTFAVGNSIEIRLGYAGDLEPVFAGEITALEPQFNAGQLPNLTVRGYDRRHRLQRGCNTRTFLKQKDSAIAAQIAQEAGLTSEVTDTEVIHDYVLQADQTDLAFLQARARQIQYEVIVEGKKLLFRPVGNAASAILTLTLEDDLLEFAPRLSAAGQVSHTSVRGWNFKEKKEIVGKATAGNEVSTMGGQRSGARLSQTAFGKATEQVSDRPVATKAEADQRAVALLNRDVLMLVTGEGICQGRTDLRAGKVIKIDRIGKRFSGEYYVTSASHRYSSGGYYTHFTVRRNAV